MERCTAYTCFLTHIPAKLRRLLQKSPNRAIHSVNPHRSHVFEKGKQILMGKPLVIIGNGLPGTGKTTLAKRLAADAQLPVLHLDGMYKTLYDALACQMHGRPPLLGPATFTMLHYVTGSLLAAGQSVIVEGFWLFGSRKSRVSPTATGTRF